MLCEASGVLGNNTRESFDIQEFRGFSICDEYAPLIFINKKDTYSAQVFTLIHEFAHLLLGFSGISNSGIINEHLELERWCNNFAAELLVPSESLTNSCISIEELEAIAKQYKVSAYVVLIQLRKAKLILPITFDKLWTALNNKIVKVTKSSGGNNLNNIKDRLSKRFACALINSTESGITLFTDAFRMLNVKGKSYWKLSHALIGGNVG